MNEWNTEEFGGLFTTVYRYPTYYDIEYVENGVPEIRGELLATNGMISDDYRFISPDTANNFPKVRLEIGDIVMSVRGTLGKIGLVKQGQEGSVITANLLRLSPNRSKVNSGWLLQMLLSQKFLGQLENVCSQTTIKTIQVPKLCKILVDCPPLPQQRRIAEILSTLDEAIEQTEALIAKMQQIKAGLMHDLFTRGVTRDGRLRSTREQAPDLYKESPLGWIPKEWEVEKLGVILRRCGGYLQTGPFGSQLHAHEYQTEGVPVVMPQDINDGLIDTVHIARVHERRANDLARHRMCRGDIVIARRGELSRAAAIIKSEQGWVCGTGCFLLRLGQSSLSANFAAYVYRHDFVQRQIVGRAVGTTMPSLNNSVMAGLYFLFCNKDEQARIVERLEGVERSIRVLSEGLLVTRQIKHGLMHDLLTGKVRVQQ
jgi:type I restriction enzyme S subunit